MPTPARFVILRVRLLGLVALVPLLDSMPHSPLNGSGAGRCRTTRPSTMRSTSVSDRVRDVPTPIDVGWFCADRARPSSLSACIGFHLIFYLGHTTCKMLHAAAHTPSDRRFAQADSSPRGETQKGESMKRSWWSIALAAVFVIALPARAALLDFRVNRTSPMSVTYTSSPSVPNSTGVFE